jgi:uncharacterized protein YgiM (DUF1202 family)
MKYVLSFLTTVFLFIQISHSGTITGDSVNVRSGPSVKTDKTGVKLSKGESVDFAPQSYSKKPVREKIGTLGNHPWWHVTFTKNGESVDGYVFGAFIEWEITRDCTMHKKPADDSSAVKSMKRGAKVKVLELTPPVDDTGVPYWALVKDNTGTEGWVSFDYLR